ncbi:MAG: TRAP transporter TatT component family protein [Myxococcota bacterium]|nr:TRAP transporter TatT component family protein [Myxococcota bacterium]
MNSFAYKQMLLVMVFGITAAGCNMKQMVIKSSYLMMEDSMKAFNEEPDTQLAAEAAPSNLKLLEGMAKGAPENAEIQLAAAQMLGMYAFGFLEDSTADETAQEIANQRARNLYRRAREYSINALEQAAAFRSAMNQDSDQFKAHLTQYDQAQVPALFWTAFSWGLYVNLSRTDIAALADLPKVMALTERIAELDERYFFGGAHMFLMVSYGSVGPSVGGDPQKAKAHFEKAWQISGGKYLMTKYLFAKYYCQQTLDEALFKKLLTEIINAPNDLFPEQTLSNTLAKEKAARLLKQTQDIF